MMMNSRHIITKGVMIQDKSLVVLPFDFLRVILNTIVVGMKTMCVGMKTMCVGAKTMCVGAKTMCVGVKTMCVGVKTMCVGVKTMCVGAKTVVLVFGTFNIIIKNDCRIIYTKRN